MTAVNIPSGNDRNAAKFDPGQSASRPTWCPLESTTFIRPTMTSNFNLPAHLNHPVGWNAEKLGGVERELVHQDEELLAPARKHVLRSGCDDLFPPNDH